MATPAFRQAFDAFGEPEKLQEAIQRTVVKIIYLDYKDNPWHEGQEWHQQLSAEGIHISYLQHPCTLDTIDDKTGTLAHIEVKHCFTDRFWPKVEQEPVAGAICISHLRALHEALVQHPDASFIVLLEADVMGNDNTT